MRKIISLFFVAVLAIGSFSCKKDPEVNMERIRIHENEKQFSTNGETISMSLSGSVSCSKEISKMTLWLGSKQDLSDAVGYDILLHDTAFSVEVNDLGSDATYYYRYGIYRYSTEFGKEMEIGGMQTNEVSTHNLLYVPKVETGEVLQVMQTSAVVKGTVVNDGGIAIIEKGVCWSTDSIPTIADNHIPSETGEVSFSVSITELSSETTYYVRAYAKNEVGVGYGVIKSFTTLAQSQDFTVSVSANPSNGGTVSGGGTYQQGQSCTVTATANTGFSFSSWIENGNVVSTNASYTFMVNGNRSLVANFTAQPQNYTISVSANPTNGGTVSGGGTYQQGQNCTVTATANNGFSFSNWTKNGSVVSTNASYTFAVNANVTLIANFIGVYNGHEYVDLGLPSGLLWATCNVGANSLEDYGDYFAWGETQPKSWYNWNYYQHCQGGEYKLTKYCNNSSVGLSGFVDDLTTLLPEDDAATANWGGDWRMPTKEEFEELYAHTTCTWTSQAGVSGRLFTASNGNSLFLPAAGHRDEGFLTGNGSNGFYWSSSLYADDPYKAWGFFFLSNNYIVSKWGRCEGYSVRAVYTSQDPVLQTIPLAFPQVPPTAVR